MEGILPILFASFVGVGHAFEADHLLAVSNIVAKRDSYVLAIKDGFYWGLGHTTTIVILGSAIILSRITFLDSPLFEMSVGVMLVVMGLARLTNKDNFRVFGKTKYKHGLAYTVGLVHGLAGSGALVLLVMSEIKDVYLGILYLLVFGVGSIFGMLVAAGLFNIPFTKRMKINNTIKGSLMILSSILCIAYGGYIIYQNV